MRILVSIFVVVSLLLNSGCAIYEKEVSNRGGYLDFVLDEHWMKADSKRMRALRAFAMQVSLARLASVSAKNDLDRQLLAARIGQLTGRFGNIYKCAFNDNPLSAGDTCFYYDSAMVEYSTGLFDLAMVALPIDDAKKLVSTVTGSIVNPINIIELLTSLLQIGKDAIKSGRVAGALYRDTVELEVQAWLATPDIDARPSFRVTEEAVSSLRAVYLRGNDDMPAWIAEMAALRSQGLEPLPQPKFFVQLNRLMFYICNLITKEPMPLKACLVPLPGLRSTALVGVGNLAPTTGLGAGTFSGIGIGTGTGRGTGTRSGGASPDDRDRRPVLMANATGAGEKTLTVTEGRSFQQTLCVPLSDGFDKNTRDQLKNFNDALLYPSVGTKEIVTTSDLANLRAAQMKFPDCKRAGFVNGFEVGLFARFDAAKVRGVLLKGLTNAKLQVPAAFNTTPTAPLVIDDATRKVIESLANTYGTNSGAEITRSFYDKLVENTDR
jgi:hypothetical protein